MRADIHNHTRYYSPDAKMTIDELIASAVKRGIEIVGITEHYEYDNPDPDDDIGVFDLNEYTKSFAEWRSKCPDNLKLLMGIEFGYQTHTASVIDQVAMDAPFDVVILSNHLFRGRDVYFIKDEYLTTIKFERHTEYMNKMAEMCENCNNYNVAAHFDYINRYNPDPDERLLYTDCPDAFDRFFEALITKEKALEINTRSILKLSQKCATEIMPDELIIRRYLEMGGKLITLGSDSHTPDTLGVFFDETREYLKYLGVNELCYFENRKPVLFSI